MLARCARCQGTFTTDHFGLQTCPHCGADLMLADPNAPAGAQGAQAPAAPPPPPGEGGPPSPAGAQVPIAPPSEGGPPSPAGAQVPIAPPGEGGPPSPPASAGGVVGSAAGGEGRGEGGAPRTGPSAGAAPTGNVPVWGAPPPPVDMGRGGRTPELPPPPGPPPGGYGPPPPGWGPPVGGGWGPPPGAPGPEQPAPFAERARLGFFPAFLATWRRAALEPADFFRRVRIDQTRSAVLFAVIATSIGSWASAIWNYLTSLGSAAQFEERLAQLPPDIARYFELLRPYVQEPTSTALIVQLVLTPLLAFVSLYLSAGILHLFLVLFRGAGRGFGATLTVVSYASAVNLLLVVPFCGSIVAVVWWIVIVIAGLEAAQRCGTGKAAAATFAPVALACLCLCGLGAIGFGAAFRALNGGTPPGGSVDL